MKESSWGYSSQSKDYKIYNKRTQCVEESVHVIFDESYPSCEKINKDDQDGEPLMVPGEVINMTNGKADMMSQVKEPSGDNAGSSSREPDFGVYNEYVPLLRDNTSALNMAKNPVQHKRTKRIDVRHHFLRDDVEKGLICMKFCSTEDQIADIFTKALSREHFEKNRLKLGLLKPN
ncbi:PREDICTED: uncharacterized protein LOC109240233 [Nicotiana attenuata]|uniref:uncharacterized protein LOC109240233 n=1 Tax=Nicotiana attenuata TaxID=49451 RepID=UPI000904A377|nr:PREDICTED: uncharacterized protein LOC109240233 [Nicotiana attenuata]